MDRSGAVLLTVVAGALIALQAPINSTLGRNVGTFQAALTSFALGTVVLALVVAFARGGFADIGEARGLSWYYLTGGVLGAIYVATVLVTVRELGAGGVTAATIASQLTASVLIDRFGWLGVQQQPITAARIAGVLLLCAGVALIVRG
ncbi:DMT family transporter [Paraconexibacter sp.]|uniref:DMT family transporter n=1 Tax=Paraconexibacter sp. TaxID=2949640 RepID=UPI0035635BA0